MNLMQIFRFKVKISSYSYYLRLLQKWRGYISLFVWKLDNLFKIFHLQKLHNLEKRNFLLKISYSEVFLKTIFELFYYFIFTFKYFNRFRDNVFIVTTLKICSLRYFFYQAVK